MEFLFIKKVLTCINLLWFTTSIMYIILPLSSFIISLLIVHHTVAFIAIMTQFQIQNSFKRSLLYGSIKLPIYISLKVFPDHFINFLKYVVGNCGNFTVLSSLIYEQGLSEVFFISFDFASALLLLFRLISFT